MSTLASFFCIIRFAKSSWGLVVSYGKKKKKKTIQCGRFSSLFAIFKRKKNKNKIRIKSRQTSFFLCCFDIFLFDKLSFDPLKCTLLLFQVRIKLFNNYRTMYLF